MPPNGFTTFINDEDGAVTSDWVVLTALALGMCIAVYTTLGDGAHEHGELIDEKMVERGIPSYGLTETKEN